LLAVSLAIRRWRRDRAQRTVIALRDVEGWSSEEVSDALEISAGNQRILLHRARSRVRNAIESYYGAAHETASDAVTRDPMGDTSGRTTEPE
jgi:hypothetical protein